MKLIIMCLIAAGLCFASDYQTEHLGTKPYSYPLATCLSCGDGLGENFVTLIHADRVLKFCSIECVSAYTKSPETYISNLEEQIKASQRKSYPLKTCVISGHELGSMGDPVEYVSGNTLVKFCCGACIEKFEQDREQMLYKLNAAYSDRPSEIKPPKQ